MAAETKDLRDKARRVKNLALSKAIEILENPGKHDKELYEQTYLTALKNAVPRTQEVTGEDGKDLIPTPILGTSFVQLNNSDNQSSQPQEENTSGAGGNLGIEDNLDSSLPDTPGTVGQ